MAEKKQEAPGALELVREFVNTADLMANQDELDTAAALVRWLAARGLVAGTTRATPADVRSAIDLREALRSILLAHTDGEPAPAAAWEVVDGTSERARLRVRFSSDGAAALEPDASGIDCGLGRLLAIVHDAIAHGAWPRMKACRDDECLWAFYDHTKNRSGSWCTMQSCGNRAKARAYRERNRHEPAAD
jgi:predicted RNA-binding Zn ribbon-like protein